MIIHNYTPKEVIAQSTAKILLDIKAVHVNANEPFVLTSGARSPVYIDCRKLISFPRIRAALMSYSVSLLAESVGLEYFASIAGGETAGIPFAAFLSERLALPMQYVRKKPKGFGRNAQIEGHIEAGSNVLLMEDLATDAGSKFMFADALRSVGANCDHILVIFYYDIFSSAQKKLADHGLHLHYLATWWDILAELKESRRFDEKIIESVEAFLNDPVAWSVANGGTDS